MGEAIGDAVAEAHNLCGQRSFARFRTPWRKVERARRAPAARCLAPKLLQEVAVKQYQEAAVSSDACDAEDKRWSTQ